MVKLCWPPGVMHSSLKSSVHGRGFAHGKVLLLVGKGPARRVILVGTNAHRMTPRGRRQLLDLHLRCSEAANVKRLRGGRCSWGVTAAVVKGSAARLRNQSRGWVNVAREAGRSPFGDTLGSRTVIMDTTGPSTALARVSQCQIRGWRDDTLGENRHGACAAGGAVVNPQAAMRGQANGIREGGGYTQGGKNFGVGVGWVRHTIFVRTGVGDSGTCKYRRLLGWRNFVGQDRGTDSEALFIEERYSLERGSARKLMPVSEESLSATLLSRMDESDPQLEFSLTSTDAIHVKGENLDCATTCRFARAAPAAGMQSGQGGRA
ncbi:hypothetical protein B0H13DRAFT_1896252 [Mycena leptocephala]|nr:hypothetical protein B0H13DRAFT_1896252 [Mycena leptocephala]